MSKPKFDKSKYISWSQISGFEYNKENWYCNYYLNKKDEPSKEMLFGKYVDERLQNDPTYLPQVPRFEVMQHKLEVMFGKIKLLGYADGFNKSPAVLIDYKTGKTPWTQKRADDSGQLTMYSLMNYIQLNIHPKDCKFAIIWLPTQDLGDFTIGLVEPVVPKIFYTKRTIRDITNFGMRINKIYKEMEEYVNNHV